MFNRNDRDLTLWINDDALGELEGGTEPKKVQKCIDDKELQKLVDWFTLALFGEHVRDHEAQTWREGCDRYFVRGRHP